MKAICSKTTASRERFGKRTGGDEATHVAQVHEGIEGVFGHHGAGALVRLGLAVLAPLHVLLLAGNQLVRVLLAVRHHVRPELSHQSLFSM